MRALQGNSKERVFWLIEGCSEIDDVVRNVADLGLPGVILVITMAATGFAGAAAITTALAALGGFLY